MDRSYHCIVFAITNHFKNKVRFAGRIQDDVNQYLSSFIKIGSDLNFNSDQILKLFLSVFDKKTKKCIAHLFQAKHAHSLKLETHYAKNIICQYIKTIFKNIYSLFIWAQSEIKRDPFVSQRLEYLKRKIIKFWSQGLPHHLSGLDLVEYVHGAVAGQGWAQLAAAECSAANVP